VARALSEDMIARDFFDHVNPDGEDPFDRMADVGITYQTAGENFAWNNFSNPVEWRGAGSDLFIPINMACLTSAE